ncbi:MAG: hypothetical protein JXJ04_05730 [Spirochaetales bacterium]|nr:hypothetical protein [Spirochaetales bacterium]
MKRIIVILLFFISLFPIYPDAEKLTITLWTELEPFIVFEGDTSPLPEKEAVKRILEQARIIFSAMIYGYAFTYTPYDKQRQVAEYFDLRPLYEIVWGDPNLNVIRSEVRDKRLYITVHYTCMDFQVSRLEAWDTLAIPSAYGRGTGDYFKGYPEKMNSLKNAMKEAIRGYMRKRTFNKPKEISGELVLMEMADTIVNAGEYITTAKVKLNIKEVIPYKVF